MTMMRYLLLFILSCVSAVDVCKAQATNIEATTLCTPAVSLNGDMWRLATDSANNGITLGWYKNPPEALSKSTPVPWVIQDVFHNYHGVAWYWRQFQVTPQPKSDGRYFIQFDAVDYMATVWVNGIQVGAHEGGEFAFEVDITKAVKPGEKNLLVVRVLNPGYEAIDDIILKETPSSLKHHPYTSNAVYNSGGIIGDVRLIAIQQFRINDMFVVADWKSGVVQIKATVTSYSNTPVSVPIRFAINQARSGILQATGEIKSKLQNGINQIEATLKVPDHQLWSPGEPFLYRVTAAVAQQNCAEEKSVRFGFRDFRFEHGYYQLNGKRIFLIGCNFSTHYPVGYTIPLYEQMLRQDVINMKALGQNFVRIPFGCPNPRIFDIYDELGILVHQEHYGSWQMNEFGGYTYNRPERMKDSLLRRFENSITSVIKRDRNHPSIVMWGALNENHDGIVFRKAVALLPVLRALDPTRLIVLNSGRFDYIKEIGSMSSPGSDTWDVAEPILKDWHPYVMIPYTKRSLDELSGRIPQQPGQKIYISESGLCFPIDLPSELGDYQQWEKADADDAQYFKRQYDKFLADWKKFGLSDNWARPEDYIKAAYQSANSLRETGEAAIRANPAVVAYTPTNGVADYSMGESVATNFRRLKPELIPGVLLGNSAVRWCMSTEPQSIYNGEPIQIRASFSNLDVLPAGKYPATITVVDPDMKKVFEEKTAFIIPAGADHPFAQSVLDKNISVSGKPGKYQLLATLDSGGTAIGGQTDFYLTAKNNSPILPKEIIVLGEDSALQQWLSAQQIKIKTYNAADQKRKLIVIAGKTAPDSITMLQVAGDMAKGSVVIFLSAATLKKRNNTTGWLPLQQKGIISLVDHVGGYYRADRWGKRHPVLEGLSQGGMLDYKYFRNLINIYALCQEYNTNAKPVHTFQEVTAPLIYPDEIVCGATRISHNYSSGIQLGVWNFKYGKFIVNTLSITENLGVDPAADRLMQNLLRFAALDLSKKAEHLPAEFQQHLKAIGYQQ